MTRAESADRFVFVGVLAVLVLGAAGGPGWWNVALDGVIAVDLERTASAPLYGVLAGAFARLPVGEVGFRLALLSALAGAGVIVGVMRAARALLPRDPIASVAPAVLLLVTPAVRDAAGFAGSSIVVALGVAWTAAFGLEHARAPSPGRALRVVAAVAVVVGCAPWLGVLVAAVAAAWLWRRHPEASRVHVLVVGAVALGIAITVLWIGALGRLPGAAFDASATVEAVSRGAGAVVLGAGLLGVAFAAVTGLPAIRWVAGLLAVVALHAFAVDHDPVPTLAVLAIAAAVIPSAVVRFVGTERRHVVAAVAGAPLVLGALLAGPAFGVDDPDNAPARLAADVTGSLPPGPGVFVANRPTTWAAVEYAQRVAGYRPDLELPPPLPPGTAAALAVNSMRGGQIVGSEVPAFGDAQVHLYPQLAFPRGRGFQLLLAPPAVGAPIPLVARYRSQLGAQQATLLALERARYEQQMGRLALAARAAGLTERFGAADLAMLSTTAPSPARPELFRFVPNLDGLPPGPWLLDLLGDDLAWMAGIDTPLVDAPRARRLHGLWRALWRNEIQRSDPRFAELGRVAVDATDEMLATLKRASPTPSP
ncbi:MAG TPA: hypothetical protein VFQ53_22110 [Kofleriaceae bacterium]|nr:hypothetical protein [Kofleriaceae bacterium]